MIDGQGPLQGLGVTVGFLDGRAVVGIPGEVDSVTGPDLAAVVDAVLARRHLSVVFALPEVTFMDGRGVRVIDNYVRRLGQIGGSVAIRSPSVVIAWVVDVVGLSGAVRVERSDREPDRLAAEQFAAAPGVPIVVETNPDGGPVRAVTAIPTRTDAALRLVVAVARLPRDGVSVSLNRHGRPTTVAATDQTVSEMDQHQYGVGEGPCVDAARHGRWFHAESLSEDPLASVHPQSRRDRDQRHPFHTAHGRGPPGRRPQHLLALTGRRSGPPSRNWLPSSSPRHRSFCATGAPTCQMPPSPAASMRRCPPGSSSPKPKGWL